MIAKIIVEVLKFIFESVWNAKKIVIIDPEPALKPVDGDPAIIIDRFERMLQSKNNKSID